MCATPVPFSDCHCSSSLQGAFAERSMLPIGVARKNFRLHYAPHILSPCKRFGAGNNTQQSRFSFTISTDQRYLITTALFPLRYSPQLLISAKFFSNVLLMYRLLFPGILSTWKLILIFRAVNRHIFDPFELIQPLHGTLRSSSFGSFGTETLNKTFLLTDIFLLVFKRTLL